MLTCVVGQLGDRKTPGSQRLTTRALDHIEKENSLMSVKKRLTHETRFRRPGVMKKWKEDR